MDNLQQVKAKLEQMKAKYNFEHENEDNPNHSDGWGMFYSGFFTCLKEISFFIDTLEVKEVDLEKEYQEYVEEDPVYNKLVNSIVGKAIAKHFFEFGLRSTITEEDCKLIWNIGDDLPYMPEEDFFKELLKRYKTQKGG